MKKRIKDLVMGFLIGCLLMSATPVLANTVLQKIDVALNTIKVEVNGENLNANNILYNGTTYLPMRAIAEAVGKEVQWEQETMTASIIEKNIDVKIEDVNTINNNISYEEFINMFDLRFSIDENGSHIRHFIYNGDLSYENIKNVISSYDEEVLDSFGKQTIENIFSNEVYYGVENLIVFFNYEYYESLGGKKNILEFGKRGSEDIKSAYYFENN